MVRPVLGMLAVAAVVGGCAKKEEAKTAKKGGKPPVPVTAEAVTAEDMPQVTRGLGVVQSLHDVTIRAQVAGVLVEVLFREGQMVERGQLLARIDDRSFVAALTEAKAARLENAAKIAVARLDLGRYQALLAEEAIARQTIDQQAALVAQLEAALGANDAAIAAAETRLSFTRILSPVAGRVGMRRVDAGNFVQPSDAQGVVSVTKLDPIAVVFSMPQDLLPVLPGLLRSESTAPVVALDRPGGTPLGRGRLQVIDNQVDRATGTIKLKAELPNGDGKLWPGQSVAVELETGFAKGATTVSEKSVQRGLKGPFVYRVEDGQAAMVPVRVGHTHHGRVVILEGLSPGQMVVSDGHSRVTPGSKLKATTRTATETVAMEPSR